jgi:hypothetical protein
VTHLAADLFFTIALLGAAVAVQLTVQNYWTEIMLALKGEWGRETRISRPAARPKAAPALPARRAGAF